MNIAQIQAEILRVVSNQNRSSNVLTWVQQAMREIQARHRWWFLQTDVIRPVADYLALPSDCEEVIDPLFIWDGSNAPTPGNITITTTTLPDGARGILYTPVVLSATYAGSAWGTPSEPWEFEKAFQLYKHKGDYRVSNFGIEFHDRWHQYTSSYVWLKYYRNMTIPTTTSEELDLPDPYVFRIALYGAAKYGLLSEDDYDRLQYAQQQFELAVKEMREWDNRKRVANAADGLYYTSTFNDFDNRGFWPENYSV